MKASRRFLSATIAVSLAASAAVGTTAAVAPRTPMGSSARAPRSRGDGLEAAALGAPGKNTISRPHASWASPSGARASSLFVLTGMAAALAGMMMSLQVVNFYPNLGTGLLLPALAAVFVGGTSVFGGRGSVYGTFIGALMIGAIPAGIVASGLTDFWTQAIYGAIILIAISIHAILQRRFQR